MMMGAAMGPVEIEITATSETGISVSSQYPSETTPLRKKWSADRAVVDGIYADLQDVLEDATSEPGTQEEAAEYRAEIAGRLKALGLALFQEILKEEGDLVREVGDSPEAERYLIFKIDRSLAYLPVEILHDGEDFVSRKIAIGRIIYTDSAGAPAPGERHEPLRVLVAADPSDDPAIRSDIEEEISILKRVFSQVSAFALRIFLGPEVSHGSMLAELPGATVFHFTGHGTVSSDERRTGIKLEEGKVLSGETIRGLQDPPRFAFLNMCTSAPRNAWQGSLGLVETLLRRGTAACVASLWDLRSRAATELASSFYAHLVAGDSFGHALRKARAEIVSSFGIHDPTWAAYALYGDPRLGILSSGRPAVRRGGALHALATVCGVLILLAALLYPVTVGQENLGSAPPVPVGYLVVETDPADAILQIDGEDRGLTPSTAEIPVGSHHVVIRKQGYRRWEAWVEIRESERTLLDPNLERLR
jgi:hypothetical protein